MVQCYTDTYSNSSVVSLFNCVLCNCKVLQKTHIASLSPHARTRSIFIVEFIIIILETNRWAPRNALVWTVMSAGTRMHWGGDGPGAQERGGSGGRRHGGFKPRHTLIVTLNKSLSFSLSTLWLFSFFLSHFICAERALDVWWWIYTLPDQREPGEGEHEMPFRFFCTFF